MPPIAAPLAPDLPEFPEAIGARTLRISLATTHTPRHERDRYARDNMTASKKPRNKPAKPPARKSTTTPARRTAIASSGDVSRATCWFEAESSRLSLDEIAVLVGRAPAAHSFSAGDTIPLVGTRRASTVWRSPVVKARNGEINELIVEALKKMPAVVAALASYEDGPKRVVVGVFTPLATTTVSLNASTSKRLSEAGLDLDVCVYPVSQGS